MEKYEKKYHERLENKTIQAFLQERYRKEFELHEWLLQSSMRCMDKTASNLDNFTKDVTYFLFIKGFKTFWSILILCKQLGLGSDQVNY